MASGNELLMPEMYVLNVLKDAMTTKVNEARAYFGNIDPLLITNAGAAQKPVGFEGASDEQLFSIANASVVTNPDAEWDLHRDVSSGDEQIIVSTPVIIVELEDAEPTQSSNQGAMIYGNVNYSITVFVTKMGREHSSYKSEAVFMANAVRKTLSLLTGARYLVGKTSFGDFELGVDRTNMVSGATIPVQTSVNNFNYSIS